MSREWKRRASKSSRAFRSRCRPIRTTNAISRRSATGRGISSDRKVAISTRTKARSHKDHTPPFGESLWLRAFVRVNSMHEPCHHVAVSAADLYLRARSEDEEEFADGVRLDLLDLRQIDDRRAEDRKRTRLNSSHECAYHILYYDL